MELLLDWFRSRSLRGQIVRTDKGGMSMQLQKNAGDLLMNVCDSGELNAIEIKCEEKNKHGNLYLETWSNLSRFTPGWMYHLNDCDFLCYFFVDDGVMYSCRMKRLKKWAFGSGGNGGIYRFPERPQSKYDQLNDTWGRCVPISVLEKDVGLKKSIIVEVKTSAETQVGEFLF